MKCLKDEKLMQYADKEFTSRKEIQVTKHIESCSTCRKNLQHVQEQINLVKQRAGLLYPEADFNKGFIYPPDTTATKSSARSILSWLQNSISIPAPVLATFFGAILLLAGFLVIQSRKISKLETSLAYQKEQAQMYRVVNNEIKTMILKTNLSNFKPIGDPQIYVVKEKENDI